MCLRSFFGCASTGDGRWWWPIAAVSFKTFFFFCNNDEFLSFLSTTWSARLKRINQMEEKQHSVRCCCFCLFVFLLFLPPPKKLHSSTKQAQHTQAEENCCWPSSITFSLSHSHTLTLSGHVTSTNISQLHNRKITYELQHTRLTFYNAWVFVLSYDTKLVCWWTKRVLVNRSKTHQLMLGRIGACVCCSRLRPEGSS